MPARVELAHGLDAQVVAALHVVDAGAVAAPAVAPPGEGPERADGVDRIHVPHDQDAGLARLGVGKAGAQAIAEAHAAGDALHRRAHDGELARRKVHHAVDRAGVPGRALAFDPRAQAVEHGIGIERKRVRVHRPALWQEMRRR